MHLGFWRHHFAEQEINVIARMRIKIHPRREGHLAIASANVLAGFVDRGER